VAVLHTPQDSERFGLKITWMVFPVEGHRIKPLANLTSTFDERSPTQREDGPPQALGLLGAIGFVALLWIALTGALRHPAARARDRYVQATATATLAALVLGVAGGIATVIAYTASPLVRSWSRLSIVIAFFALIAVGKALDRVGPALRSRGVRPALVAAGLVGLVVVASVEQTSNAMVPKYAAAAATWRSDKAFGARAAQILPRGSFVFELPYVPFPEAVYVHARPYLQTDALRWTFGAMSGRAADWSAALVGLPPKATVESAAAAGASGVFVEREAYADSGRALMAALGRLLGPPRLVDDTNTLALYDLRPYAATLRARLGPARFAELRALTLHPIRVLPGPQLSGQQHPPNTLAHYYRLSFSRNASLDLVNPSPHPRTVNLTLGVSSLGPPSAFTLQTPDGEARFLANPTATGSGTITLGPGHNHVEIHDLTPPQRFEQNFFTIDSVLVQDVNAARLLG
jgi:hypothetical protein